jgi:hypothetical protein
MAKKIKKAKKVVKNNKVKAKKPAKKTIKKKLVKKIIKKAVKRAVKKPLVKMAAERPIIKEKPIGEIVHYFSNIGVAVIKLSSPLSVGEGIRIAGGENTDFAQKVDSMQMDHEKILKANSGDEVGLKIKEKAREGYRVYRN